MLAFRPLLLFGDVIQRANDTRNPPLASGASQIELSEPPGLNPPDLVVCPPEPKLSRGALWFRGIERGVVGRPYPFHIIRMYPSHDLFDSGFILVGA